jgi:DNA-binding CsgD family transcriptional regulator
MRFHFVFYLLLIPLFCSGQYQFSGFTNPQETESTVYLSIVEDYRKLSGVYSEQIVAKTETDTKGYFEFNGDLIEDDNKIYRIHIDTCSEDQKDFNHFNGHCSNSEAFLFIASNNDTLQLPLTYDNEVFCEVESTNPKASAFLKIDSLKNEMRFAYAEVRSEVNRRLNNKKWFKTLQDFGKTLEEPIAELAIYAYLSDRGSEFHNYYVEDLKNNNYYNNLKTRLETKYPKSTYTAQYKNELDADFYMVNQAKSSSSLGSLNIVLYILLLLSLFTNIYFIYKNRNIKQKSTTALKAKLSKQEKVVLEHILQDKTNKDIAESLFLSVSTVKSHTNNIYKKLNVQSRSDTKSLFSK